MEFHDLYICQLPQLLSDVFCWASKDVHRVFFFFLLNYVHRVQTIKMYLFLTGEERDIYISVLNIANGIVALTIIIMVMLSTIVTDLKKLLKQNMYMIMPCRHILHLSFFSPELFLPLPRLYLFLRWLARGGSSSTTAGLVCFD